jgi:hypothetical protein
LDAALGAGGPIEGVMVKADFEMALARAVAEVSADVYIEASRDQAFADLTKEVIQKVLLNNPAVITPTAPPLPDGGVRPADPGNAPIYVDVRAAITALRAMGDYTYRLTLEGGNVNRIFSTNAIVRANWSDPGTEFLRAYSDGTDAPYMFSQNLAPGMTLTLAPQPRVVDDISWQTTTGYYYTKAHLLGDEWEMPSQFPRLQSWPNSVVEKGDFPAYMYDGWTINVFNWSYYTWGWEQASPSYARASETPTTLDDPGMLVEFAGSRRFTLRELATSNEYWDAHVDDVLGQLTIAVKRDLEQLKVRNADTYDTTDVYPLRRFQRYWSGGGNLIDTTYADADHTRSVPTRRSYVELRVHAETPGAGSVDARSIEVQPGADGVLRAPPANP